MKRVVKYIVYAFVVLLVINFGVKAYWKMKSYSFSAYLKDAWTYCHEKGLNEDYCLFVDFSRPSGEDRMALYDFKTQSMPLPAPTAMVRATRLGGLNFQMKKAATAPLQDISRWAAKAIRPQ